MSSHVFFIIIKVYLRRAEKARLIHLLGGRFQSILFLMNCVDDADSLGRLQIALRVCTAVWK